MGLALLEGPRRLEVPVVGLHLLAGGEVYSRAGEKGPLRAFGRGEGWLAEVQGDPGESWEAHCHPHPQGPSGQPCRGQVQVSRSEAVSATPVPPVNLKLALAAYMIGVWMRVGPRAEERGTAA